MPSAPEGCTPTSLPPPSPAQTDSSTSTLTPGASARRPGIGPSLARRVLDVAVAVLILALSLPLLLMLAISACLSTGGSPIFRQRRIGQGGVPFTLYKFRTMRAGIAGPDVTAPGDHRVTRLGALLRKTSVDELPQMVNLLLGHMTLVGPRPESVSLAARYPREFQFIFQYRPGVTGPSQVLVRDERVLGEVLDVETFYLAELVPHRVATDLSYLSNPTLTLTIRWLVGTVLYLARITRPRLAAALATAGMGPSAAASGSVDELRNCAPFPSWSTASRGPHGHLNVTTCASHVARSPLTRTRRCFRWPLPSDRPSLRQTPHRQ
jgi:lipopolysaccharide/colanic/teichoic acid biosynthesis glycosyltransferase